MHTSSHNEALGAAVAVVVVGLLVLRRLRGRPVSGRRQFVAIAAMALYGGAMVAMASRLVHPGHLTGGDVALLAASAAVSLALGAIRGRTVRLFLREGELYARYTPVTVVLWLVTFAIRLGLDAGAPHFHVAPLVARSSLVFMFALSLLGETVVVKTLARRPIPGAPALAG